MNLVLDPAAYALRPVRIVLDEAIHYTGTMFPGRDYLGCELVLRRANAFGYLRDEPGDLWVDVLDSNGDILQEIGVTRLGFEYLRRVLKFKREQQ